MKTPLDRVRAYYGQIDRSELDSVMSMFAEHAVYQRADRTYRGKERIARFFRDERRIRGTHLIEEVWQGPVRIVALGVFKGVGESGDPRCVGFTDFWVFDGCGKVTERRTYLAAGHAIVER